MRGFEAHAIGGGDEEFAVLGENDSVAEVAAADCFRCLTPNDLHVGEAVVGELRAGNHAAAEDVVGEVDTGEAEVVSGFVFLGLLFCGFDVGDVYVVVLLKLRIDLDIHEAALIARAAVGDLGEALDGFAELVAGKDAKAAGFFSDK